MAAVIGGAERVLYEQCTRLASRGHDVQVLTRLLPNHGWETEMIDGVREWRYKVDRSNDIALLFSGWRNSRKLFEKLCSGISVDCINFYQPFSAFGVISSQRSVTSRKIYTCLSLSFEEFVSRQAQPSCLSRKVLSCLKVWARKRIEKRVLCKSDVIMVLSRYTHDTLWDAYHIPPQDITVNAAGVDLEKFRPAEDKAVIRQQVGLQQDKVIVLTVRNLVPRMGLENLLQGLHRVVGQLPDLYLVIGGDGPLRNELSALASRLGLNHCVRFDGFIQEEQLSQYYRAADMFVLPTRELEGFGLVTLEALACGVPVLGTPVGGTKEILGGLDPSFLFEDTTPESMATLILEKYRQIKEHPVEWAEICGRCRQFVKENYSWEKNVDALENVLFSLSKQNRAARL